MKGKGNKKEPAVPPPQKNYEVAFRLAREEIKNCDLAERSRAAGAEWLPEEGIVRVKMLGRNIHYLAEKRDVVEPGGKEVELWEKIVILHYLVTAGGKPPSGNFISYKDIPDGRLYWPNFVGRVHRPLIKAFGSNPQMLTETAKRFEGKPYEKGDAAALIPALPRVSLLYIIWGADEEFSADAACLFDETISDYLPAEDITVLSSMTAIKMMKAAFGGQK